MRIEALGQRAVVASLSSDLENAAKQLKLDSVDLGMYPAANPTATNGSPQAANVAAGGAGLKNSNGTTYQYQVNNAATPPTFCLTATNGNTSYYITQGSGPTAGGCPGDGVGGVAAITNLVPNPSVESTADNWVTNFGTGGVGTSTLSSVGGAASGSNFFRMAWTTGSSDTTRGIEVMNIAATAGKTYSASISTRTSRSQRMIATLLYRNSSGGITQPSGPSVVVLPSVWTTVSIANATAPAGTTSVSIRLYSASGSGSSPWQAGDTLDGDAAILTESPTVPNYADGNTPNWRWSDPSNPNLTTSSGPPV